MKAKESYRKIGEGIFVRDGLIRARVTVMGKERTKSFGADLPANRTRAKLWRQEVQSAITVSKDAGEPWQMLQKLDQARQKRTFEEVATEYMDERKDGKESSQQSYRSILNKWLLPKFGQRDIALISEAQIAAFQTSVALSVTSSRTNTIMQLFRQIMATAKRRGYIQIDPCPAVRRKQEPKPKINPLSREELGRALNSLDDYWRPLFTVLAYTGMRQNEVLALTWDDVDWISKTVNVDKGMYRKKVGQPKTTESNRLLPLVPQAEAAIREVQSRKIRSTNYLIFTTPSGQPIIGHLDRQWRQALKRAGIQHRPAEQLRHTFASDLLMKGMQPGYVAKLLGHSGLEVMYRHYARWIEDASKDEEIRLRNAFENESDNVVRSSLAICD